MTSHAGHYHGSCTWIRRSFTVQSCDWWTVDVDVAVSLQHEAAASNCVSSLSGRRFRAMLLLLSRRLCSSPSRLMCPDPTPVDARALCGDATGVQWTWMRLRSPAVHRQLMSASPHCPGVVFMRWRCSCLDVSRSSSPQSTFVCPLVVDASPCSLTVLTVLSRSWWSADVDAGVPVQRATAASSV